MRLALVVLLISLAGCTSDSTSESPPEDGLPTGALARPSDAAIAARVAEAQARLDSTEAGRLVLAAIQEHGGLEQWYANGPIRFRYTYTRPDGEPPIDTEQTVDTWSSRAVHHVVQDQTADHHIAFGWTGEQAWVLGADPDSLGTNARFWSLTPYYFVGMPFVLADPGVNLEVAGQMVADSTSYDLVRATFDEGIGDAPDDYYYLLLDPETRRVGGVRYVVSYPGFFPDGGTTPERLMLYDGVQTVGGITLQRSFRSFAWTGSGAGEGTASGSLDDLSFVPDAPDSLFAMPAGAVVQRDM